MQSEQVAGRDVVILLPDVGLDTIGEFKLTSQHWADAWSEAQRIAEMDGYDGVVSLKFVTFGRSRIGGDWITSLRFYVQMFGRGLPEHKELE